MIENPRHSTLAVARDRHLARAAAQFSVVSRQFRIVFVAVLLALGLRSFVYEPFNIPSESMQPSLLVGDYLFVAKAPYGYSRYSLPLGLPLFDGRLLGAPAARGDVIVFKSPRDNRTDFIKRVIGVPGDRVRLVDGQIELNGVAVGKQRVADFLSVASPGCAAPPGERCRIARYRETLPGGRAFAVLDEIAHDVRDTTATVTVPAGHYFVLGDNRDDSADSRLAVADGGVGMVPAENIVGRAERIFFSTGGGAPGFDPLGWLGGVRPDRIGRAL